MSAAMHMHMFAYLLIRLHAPRKLRPQLLELLLKRGIVAIEHFVVPPCNLADLLPAGLHVRADILIRAAVPALLIGPVPLIQ